MTIKKTLVIGASNNPQRYSYLAVEKLKRYGHPIIAIGRKAMIVNDTTIITGMPELEGIDTITLYINPELQKQYADWMISLHPKRIIFNPGTENTDLAQLAKSKGIIAQEACTLVLLGTGQY
jgi:uncharacterized protein